MQVSVTGRRDLEASTDANGQFAIHGVPIGEAVLEVVDEAESTDTKGSVLHKLKIEAGKITLCRVEIR